MFGEEGYGFILTDAGERVYFHRNAVQNGSTFGALEEGQRVGLQIESGEKGLQATLRPARARGQRASRARRPADRLGRVSSDGMHLRAEQIAAYEEQGYLVLGPVLAPGEAEALRAEEQRFRPPVAYGGAKNQTLFVNVQLCHRSAPVRRFCMPVAHLPAVVQLLGPDVCLTHQQFVTKLPEQGESSQRHLLPSGQRLRPAGAAARRHGLGRARRHRRAQRLPLDRAGIAAARAGRPRAARA